MIEAVAAPSAAVSLMQASWLFAFNQKSFKSMLGFSIRANPAAAAQPTPAPKR